MLNVIFDNAAKFLDELNPRGGDWQGKPDWWFYRGQSDACWDLYPSVFRRLKPHLLRSLPALESGYEQAIIARFINYLDKRGIHVPGDGPELRELFPTYGDLHMVATGEWPPDVATPVVALGQHFGVPTRALDWTRSAFIAAYFAACDAAEWVTTGTRPSGDPIPSHICVWAWFHKDRALSAYKHKGQRDASGWGLRVVVPPGYGNPNLQAQEGVFSMLDNDRLQLGQPINPPKHNVLAMAIQDGSLAYGGMSKNKAYPVALYKLETQEAPRLLRLLSHEGIDASRLFPGIEGAAKAAIERTFWDKPGRPVVVTP